QVRALEAKTGSMSAVQEAFGTTSGEVIPELRQAYSSPIPPKGQGGEPYVGAIMDVLERPGAYNLNSKQKRAAAEYAAIMKKEGDVTRGLRQGTEGVPPLYRRDNTLTPVTGEVTEPITDVAEAISRRLSAGIDSRAEAVFLDETAKKLAGRRIGPNAALRPDEEAITTKAGQAWAFPKAVAADLRRAVEGVHAPADDATVSRVVNEIKSTLLNFDASVAYGRQGMAAFSADPIGTMRDWGTAIQVARRPEGRAVWLSQNADRMRRWSQAGLQMNVTPTDIARPLAGGKETRPLIDRAFPVMSDFNEWQYGTVMPMLKLRTADNLLATLQAIRDGSGMGGLLKTAQDVPLIGRAVRQVGGDLTGKTDEELMRVAADAANNWLGGADWAKIGRGGAARNALLLTEGWLRGQVNTLRNATRRNSAEGILARRLILSDLGMMVGLATAGSLAATGQLPEYDPRSTNWLKVVTPAGYVSVTPNQTLYRTIARLIAGEPPNPNPMTDEGGAPKDSSLAAQRSNAVWRFFEGKLGMIPHIIIDEAREKDFGGRPIDSQTKYFLSHLAPITVQSIMDDIGKGNFTTEPGKAITRAALATAGYSVTPLSKEEQAAGPRQQIPVLDEYSAAAQTAAAHVAGGNEQLASQLAMWARADAGSDLGRQSRADLERAIPNAQEVLRQYQTALRQVRQGLVTDKPELLKYLQARGAWQNYDPNAEPTATPTPRPTKEPTPRNTPTPTATASAAKTPEPGKTPTSDYVNEQWAKRISKDWGRTNAQGDGLDYNQLEANERRTVDTFIDRLDGTAKKLFGKEWRGLTPAQQKQAEQETEQMYGPLLPPGSPTPRPRNPTATPGPTRTPTPNAYRGSPSPSPLATLAAGGRR
ncbi:MAG: hypothetical protein NTZ05_12615, partial [Chloroflexi bacterium]|nr:hypothetical protein [Chloroflexota bacterium]